MTVTHLRAEGGGGGGVGVGVVTLEMNKAIAFVENETIGAQLRPPVFPWGSCGVPSPPQYTTTPPQHRMLG